MVATPSNGGNSSATKHSGSTHSSTPTASGPSKSKISSTVHVTNAPAHAVSANVPLSARRADPLDLMTVERRGQPSAAPEVTKMSRPHDIPEAPTFRPTEEEFKDPMEYMRKIAPEGRKYGIVKVIPPESWNPSLAIDTTRFHFRVRKQELNSVEGGTRANLNYLDQLAKFHRQHGTNLNRFPSVDKRPLELYKLKKAVDARGGFEKVCKLKKWAEIGRDLGYSGKIMSSLSTSLKNSYQRWLLPYEEYLRIAKPGVHQQLELENGGPITPSPGTSPLKRPLSQQGTPSGESPAMRAHAALNASLNSYASPEKSSEPAHAAPPQVHTGFTAVNAGGFTAVNSRPATSSFTAVNTSNGFHPTEPLGTQSTPMRHLDSPNGSTNNTPNFRPVNMDGANHLKRPLSSNGLDGHANGDADASGRRSKRIKKEAPTVQGSNMHQPRNSTPKFPAQREKTSTKLGEVCETCGSSDNAKALLLCDGCDAAYHGHCLEPPVTSKPDLEWHCPKCLVGTGEFGFEDGEVYSLKQFQEKANNFKEHYFANKTHYDPVLERKRPVNEDDVEREFWRLVESISETVEVEYGADIHSTTHGSGFPTSEKQPLDPYSADPWNLNVLPLWGESLFKHIKTDISGMTVPWLYVGMVFSTFCWHNEDHYAYSANYQHLGDTKTWYGIPGEDAEKFEEAMRQAVPELFETQPDLLFQLVTLMPPEQLKKAGVRVYAIDQRAGQFVLTFPQAYHAGFNHGFNLNEAVNYAPTDWEPFGEAGVQRLRTYRRQPCFSHDELLVTAASRDHTIHTAKWLAPALERMLDNESAARAQFLTAPAQETENASEELYMGPRYARKPEINADDLEEDDYICSFCKCFSFLSRYVCQNSGRVMCLLHAGGYDCCDAKESDRYSGVDHSLYYRMTDAQMQSTVQKVVERAKVPELWAEKVDKLLEDEPRPSLKTLRSLLNEGEKIPHELPQLADLRKFVDRCNDWVEEATNYITRKSQNRRKSGPGKKNSAKAIAEQEEREKELRKVDNIRKLLASADEISFDCPEIATLRERADGIAEFQRGAREALFAHTTKTTQELEDLVEIGKSFNVDIPEVEQLEKLVQRLSWNDQARDKRGQTQSLKDVTDFIQRGIQIGVPETDPNIIYYKDLKQQGELWEAKANELMAVEHVHYQQLDSLSRQAATLPVSQPTLAKVEAILKKQREAQEKILSLYEQSKNPDFRQRPHYKDVRDVMAQLEELNSKPAGTLDLEKEQRRHEDWMRRGKKLFGKANAPLHILHQHMLIVEARNDSCFDLRDIPKMPAEPASRQHTPEDGADTKDSDEFRDVFCICRKSESGLMIKCDGCLEWYHGRCLKIARGKVNQEARFTCPICDWRVKIPRDAARPKLEELEAWQSELETLPFQPEEEETLNKIISKAQEFREYIRPYVNPVAVSMEEVPTIRFYLRKVEGADILLTEETNFLRQEMHKWAPIAPEPPPIIQASGSTRKPRPTKQQKLMAQLGITNPDDLPPQYKIKSHTTKRKSDVSNASPAPLKPAGTPNHTQTPSHPHASHTMPGSAAGPGAMPPLSRGPLQHTPSFSYDTQPPPRQGPIVTSAYRDSPLFAPAFNAQTAAPSHSHSHHNSASPAPAFEPLQPLHFSPHDAHAHHPQFSAPSPPSGIAAAPYTTNMDIDPALFGGFGSDKTAMLAGHGDVGVHTPGAFEEHKLRADRDPVFGAHAAGHGAGEGVLDRMFEDMVHHDDADAEGLESHAGEAFAAGGYEKKEDADGDGVGGEEEGVDGEKKDGADFMDFINH